MNSSLLFVRIYIDMEYLTLERGFMVFIEFFSGWDTLVTSLLSTVVFWVESLLGKISNHSQSTTVGMPSLSVCL